MMALYFVFMVIFIAAVIGGFAWLLKRADDHIDSEYELRYVVYKTPLGAEWGYDVHGEFDTIEEVRIAEDELRKEGFDILVWDNTINDWHGDV
jgi:hypothetical protein